MRKWGFSVAFALVPLVVLLISVQAAEYRRAHSQSTPAIAPQTGAESATIIMTPAPVQVVEVLQSTSAAVPTATHLPQQAASLRVDPASDGEAAVSRAASARRHNRSVAYGAEPEHAVARSAATAVPTVVPVVVPPTVAPVAAVTPPAAPEKPVEVAGPAAPDRIYAPTIRLDTRVIPVGWSEVQQADGTTRLEWTVASYAAGWHVNSAMPGQGGNIVLAAHNNVEGEIFRYIELLSPGDPIFLYAGGREYKYRVAEKFVVQEEDVPMSQRLENAKWIGPFPEERLTLISCWPYSGDTHRMFVISRPW